MRVSIAAWPAIWLLVALFSSPASAQPALASEFESDEPPPFVQLAQFEQETDAPILGRNMSWQRAEEQDPWSGAYAGTSIVFFKPFFKEAFQANIFDAVTGTATLVPYASRYNATPRAWFGYGGPDGYGVQARYWQFDQGSGPSTFTATPTTYPGTQTVTIILPAAISTTLPGEVLSVSSGLEMRTVDLEGTIRYQFDSTQALLTGGLRYAMIQQDYAAQVLSGGVPTATLDWNRRLEGVGPLIGGQFRRPLGDRGFAFVGGGRGGLIFGRKDIHRTAVGSPTVPPFPPTPNVNYDNAAEMLMNLETDLGIEWSRRFGLGDLYLRGSYEGQLWSDSGGTALGYLGMQGFGLSVAVTR